MIETNTDLWALDSDAVCITTNGFVKKTGKATMGAGCALEAAQIWPDLPEWLGTLITRHGNIVHLLELYHPYTNDGTPVIKLVCLPVKHVWWEAADLNLITFSLGQLLYMTNLHEWKTVRMPRPGCGNGKLRWASWDEDSPKRVCQQFLDDRFIIHHLEK